MYNFLSFKCIQFLDANNLFSEDKLNTAKINEIQLTCALHYLIKVSEEFILNVLC